MSWRSLGLACRKAANWPWGQYHALDEVLVLQAEQPLDGLVDPVEVLGHGSGVVPGPGQAARVGEPLQAGGRAG